MASDYYVNQVKIRKHEYVYPFLLRGIEIYHIGI
jgi:hypothetical protein